MNETEDRLELPDGQGKVYPGRHQVADAVLFRGGEAIPVVVKKIRVDWRQRLARKTKAERSFETALALLARGIRTPEPLLVREIGNESWFVVRRLEKSEQIRIWFLHRDDPGNPAPGLPFAFEEVVAALGRLARALHDGGVFYRDFSDGNVLVSSDPGGPSLWLVDLDRAQVGAHPIGWWRRLRDLSRPGLNSPRDRKLLLEDYFAPGPVPWGAQGAVSFLRARLRVWNALKRILRPWRS